MKTHQTPRQLDFQSRDVVAGFAAVVLSLSAGLAFTQDKKPEDGQRPPIPITEVQRAAPVDFEKEILPILKSNCLACHNQTTTKAELVLETPQTILKGGESGPAVVAGKSGESLLLQVASHQKKPKMPPKDNKVAAVDLTSEELGLIKRWIDQGATGEVRGAGPIVWHPLPEGLNPIYAVAVTRDGQFAACSRANQVFVYHLPSGQLVTRLTDPQLLLAGKAKPGLAHHDMVHTLDFSPDGNLLASGAYREVKLWRRPRNTQKFHFASVTTNAMQTVAASADGKWLSTGDAGGNICLWDLDNRKLAKRWAGHEQTVGSLKFSPDNQQLLSGSADGTIRVWKVPEGTLIAQAATPAEVNAVTWIAGGKQIAAGGTDQLIRLWQLPDSAKTDLIAVGELKGHQGPISSLDTILPAGEEIISGSADGSLRHWNIAQAKLVRQFDHGAPVTAVAVRKDGQRFASAGLDRLTKLWNPPDGKLIAELKGDRYTQELVADTERDLAFAKSEVDFQKAAVQSAGTKLKTETERLAKVTEANTKAEKSFLEKQKSYLVASEARAAAEKKVADLIAEVKKATDTFESAEKAFLLATEVAKGTIETAAQAKLAAEQAEQTRLDIEKLAADAATIAAKTKGASDKTAHDAGEFALKTKAFAESVAAETAAKAKAASDVRLAAEKAIDEVGAKAFAAGQIKARRDLVIAEAPEKQKQGTNELNAASKTFTESEKELKKAEVAKANAEHELNLTQNSVKGATEAQAESTTALHLAEAAQRNIESGLAAAKRAATESEKPIHAATFSPDNLTLATAGDDQVIHTWSADQGGPFDTFKGHTNSVQAVVFTTTGLLVSAGVDQSATVWDLNPGWSLERVIGTGDSDSPLIDRVNAVRFSPDGQLLATGGGEPTRSGEMKLWRVADGGLEREFKNVHSDAVFALAFSDDGKYLASGASDKFAKVCDVASGKVVKAFEGHTHHVLGVSWKRDGRTLASAGADNVIKVWDFISGERKKAVASGTNYLTAGFSKEVTSLGFIGASDQVLVTSGDDQVRILRENGESRLSFAGGTDYMYGAAATPDGRLVIAGGQDSVLRVWNGTNAAVLAEYSPPKAK